MRSLADIPTWKLDHAGKRISLPADIGYWILMRILGYLTHPLIPFPLPVRQLEVSTRRGQNSIYASECVGKTL